MYGLLLLNLQEFVCEKYGDKKWDAVKEALKLGDVSLYGNTGYGISSHKLKFASF